MFKRLLQYLIIFAAAFTLGSCSSAMPEAAPDRVVVAVVDGHVVEPFEYYVYLSEQKRFFESAGGEDIWYTTFGGTDAQTQAKLNALRQLSLVRITAAQARLIGLEPSEESVRIAETNTHAYLTQLPPALIHDTGSQFDNIFPIMLERQLFEEMYEQVTRNFAVSQADFEHFFEGYMLANPNAVQIMATVAAVSRFGPAGFDPQGTAHAVRQALEAEADPVLTDGVNITQTLDLAGSDLPAGVIAATRNLSPRQVSPILQTAETYYVIRIDARQVVGAATLASSALEEYTKLMRDEIFNQAYRGWRVNDPEIHVNHEVFDAISINDLRHDING